MDLPPKHSLEIAKAACESHGASLATLDQMREVWELGYEKCACGWIADGTNRYPMHGAGCGTANNINICSNTGIRDAYCHRP